MYEVDERLVIRMPRRDFPDGGHRDLAIFL
jgi:hypothetical protein